jgi:hypothetical protein
MKKAMQIQPPGWPGPGSQRLPLGDINDLTRQTITETFNTISYVGRNGKILLNYL